MTGWMCTSNQQPAVGDDCIPTIDISNHGIAVANLPFLQETPTYASRQIRIWKHLDRQAFETSVSAVLAFSDPSSSREQPTADLFDIYGQLMTEIVDCLLLVYPVRIDSHPLTIV